MVPCQGSTKEGGTRGEVDLPAQSKVAGGIGEAACASCYGRCLMVVVYSWGRRYRGQVSLESAVDFIPVSCKPVKGASVGNVWRVLAEVRVEFCGSVEGSQFIRVSEIDHVRVNSALVDGFLSLNVSRDSTVEWHLVAG